MKKNKIASLAIMGTTILFLSTTAFLHRNRQKYPHSLPRLMRDPRSAMRPQYVRPTADRSAPTVRHDGIRLFGALNFTADQKSKIDMLNQTQRKQLAAQCRRRDRSGIQKKP